MRESRANKWATFTHQGAAAVNVSCTSDWQRVFNHLAAVTRVTGMFHMQKTWRAVVSGKKVGKDVESPSEQKLCVLSVGRGYLVSVVTSPAFNGISSESALIHQISEVTFCNSQQQYSFAELLTLLWDARAMWSNNWEKYQIFTPFRSLCGCAGCFTGCLKDAVFVTLTFWWNAVPPRLAQSSRHQKLRAFATYLCNIYDESANVLAFCDP